MANMSYCRFENTLSDLYDCEEHMEDVLSEREHAAREELITLCKKIVYCYGDDFPFKSASEDEEEE